MPEPYQSGAGLLVLRFEPWTPQGEPHVIVMRVHNSHLHIKNDWDYPAQKDYSLQGKWDGYSVHDLGETLPDFSDPNNFLPRATPALTSGANVDSIDT